MKLKQRVLAISGTSIGLGIMILLFTFVYHFSHKINKYNMAVQQDNILNFRETLNDIINENDNDVAWKDGDYSAPKSGLAHSLKEIKSHLVIMRKDLDMSNFTQSSDGKVLKSQHDTIEAYVQNDQVFQENAKNILEIANILQRKDLIQNNSLNQNTKEQILKQALGENNADNISNDKNKVEAVTSNQKYSVLGKAPFKNFPNLVDRKDDVLVGFTLPKNVYTDLHDMVEKSKHNHHHRSQHYHDVKSGKKLNIYTSSPNLKAWQHWQNDISQFQLYDPNNGHFQQVLRDLNNSPVEDLYQHEGGTQIKLVFYLETDLRAIYKPMRYPREQETLPDHFYFSDFERHNAEIAAFNLDLAFGFHRVPPVVGRNINVTYDVKRHADKDLLKTFFVSPAGNICFHGQCDYYCDTGHAVCGHPEIMEGSLMAYMPTSTRVPRQSWRHPWRRSYHKRKKAEWEENNAFCRTVRSKPPFSNGRRLLDLMDMAVFDFLTGNMDRHHYETFKLFGNFTFTLMYDNGRGFGKSRHDEISILAPVYQCCLVRSSTLQKLLHFHRGPEHLSDKMRSLMAKDQAAPILLQPHLTALDRRVMIILKTVHKCVQKNGFDKVVLDDGF